MTTFIIIKQWITSIDGPNEFCWDGQHHPTQATAISAGFRTFKCDDFNIGQVKNQQLIWFGWMDRELPGWDRAKIASLIGLEALR